MKICEISFDYAQKHHPEEVEATFEKLRSGKSKYKNASGDQLIWWYETGIEIKAYSFGQLLRGDYHVDQSNYNSLSDQDKLEDVLRRMSVTLAAKTDNRWWSRVGIERQSFTPEIIYWAKNFSQK